MFVFKWVKSNKEGKVINRETRVMNQQTLLTILLSSVEKNPAVLRGKTNAKPPGKASIRYISELKGKNLSQKYYTREKY